MKQTLASQTIKQLKCFYVAAISISLCLLSNNCSRFYSSKPRQLYYCISSLHLFFFTPTPPHTPGPCSHCGNTSLSCLVTVAFRAAQSNARPLQWVCFDVNLSVQTQSQPCKCHWFTSISALINSQACTKALQIYVLSVSKAFTRSSKTSYSVQSSFLVYTTFYCTLLDN